MVSLFLQINWRSQFGETQRNAKKPVQDYLLKWQDYPFKAMESFLISKKLGMLDFGQEKVAHMLPQKLKVGIGCSQMLKIEFKDSLF